MPLAKRIPTKRIFHNIENIDNYAWLRANNWQEVLHNPNALPIEIREYLEAENTYQEAFMHDSKDLQEQLFQEMKARIKEDDSSVPVKDGDYYYGICYNIGAGLPDFFRSKTINGKRNVYLCGDKEKKTEYFQIASVSHSPNHQLFAFAYDDKGSEFYTIEIRDFSNKVQFQEKLLYTNARLSWAADSSGFFYTKLNENHRPHEVYYHELGTAQSQDKLVYKEADAGFFMSVSSTREGKYIFIDIHNHETTEVWLLDAHNVKDKPICVRKREKGLEYSLQTGEDIFYICTNRDGAKDFKIMRASKNDLLNDNWHEFLPYKEGRLIIQHVIYKNYLVWLERENGLPNIAYAKSNDIGNIQYIKFAEEAYDLDIAAGLEYNTDSFRFTYSSLTTPYQIFSYNMQNDERELLKEQQIPSGHNSSQYIARRIMAPAEDGELIPISLYYHKDTKIDGSAPCLLYGYGAYGISIPDGFNSNSYSLIDRGFVYAIAHIRGGKEKGTKWYETGKHKYKINSFKDYIASARYLVEQNYTNHKRLFAYGGSAGGMLMGAVANMAPKDFLAIIAIVPFVDTLNTMLDDTLPLTPPEWPEWGNPLSNKEDYELIASYSPYDNIIAQDYPYILAMSGLTDPRVTYWEASKWVAKINELKTDDNQTLLRTNMDSGHAGSADRYTKLRETAYIYAFILKLLNKGI